MTKQLKKLRRTPVEQQLRLLAIAHFVLATVGGTLCLLNLVSAVAFTTSMSGLSGESMLDAMSMSDRLGIAPSAFGLAMAAICAFAGWNLLARRGSKLAVGLALVTMVMVPFGTILGAITLAALANRSVRRRFETCRQAASAS